MNGWDGWAGGQAGGRASGRAGGLTDQQKDILIDDRLDYGPIRSIDRWIDERLDCGLIGQ